MASYAQEHKNGVVAGLDIHTGDAMDPEAEGIFDNYIVKRSLIENRCDYF